VRCARGLPSEDAARCHRRADRLQRECGTAADACGRAAWPIQPVRIRIIVAVRTPAAEPYIVSRLLSPHLQSLLGQSVIVGEPCRRGPAGSALKWWQNPIRMATRCWSRTESSLVIAPHIGQPIGYDPLKDFAPISLLTRNYHHAGRASVGASAYVAGVTSDLARSKPGQMFYASVRCRRPKPSRRRDFSTA